MSEDERKDLPLSEEARTVFNPKSLPPSEAPDKGRQATSFTPLAPRTDGDRIQIGDILNHMFEVKRFIARGGMGEVYEGVNVNSEERVAIKVILPQLAADPNVQAMFKKEAKTLTKLAHPALVQYRTIGTDPQLGVLYIVTEYIAGKNLEDVLPDIKASVRELLALTRRLADGLRVAHGLGAIHRDISPDNVLLEDGKLEKARIIDFGIAKDLDPSSKTIVGDGFAGKLNFVAPEQLGDFNREVGPWTDVYSLGLVILSIAQSKAINMGGSLVDAVDKRRKGPDLSTIPTELLPLLKAMLCPNPAERLRSMDEVISEIDSLTNASTSGSTPKPSGKPARTVHEKSGSVTNSKTDSRLSTLTNSFSDILKDLPFDPKYLIIGGGLFVVVILTLIIMLINPPKNNDTNQVNDQVLVKGTEKISEFDIIKAIHTELPPDDCEWLEVTGHEITPQGIKIALKGVAVNTSIASKAVSDLITSKGMVIAEINTNEVAPLSNEKICPYLNEYKRIRSSEIGTVSSQQSKWEMRIQDEPPEGYENIKLSAPVINFSVDDITPHIAIFGLNSTGEIDQLVVSKSDLKAKTNQNLFAETAPGHYTFKAWQDKLGWAGIMIVKGSGPIDTQLVSPKAQDINNEWQQRFRTAAAQKGWKTEMVWFLSEDRDKEN